MTARLGDAIRLCEVSRKVQVALTNSLLEGLPRAKYASFNSERPDHPSSCFEGTRTTILGLILDWIANPDPTAPRFFWLNGIAGIGKTTIARTIAELARGLGLLGADFLFSRQGEADLRNPALVFPTIAYQLARFDLLFSQRITAALEKDPGAPFASLKEQLDRLIIEPLSDLERDPARVVVVVFDAFDECEARGGKEILQLLVAAMPTLPFFLKIFVTSRPEHHIRSVLVPSSDLTMTALHDIEKSLVKSDIKLYLRARLRSLPRDLDRDLPEDWVGDEEVELLADEAGDLFIHAETILRFLSKAWDLRKQLNLVLAIVTSETRPGPGSNPFFHLDRLYLGILQDLIQQGNRDEVERLLSIVLGSIILLRDPLPVNALERLVGLDSSEASNALLHLQSVVSPPTPPHHCPRVYHPSFSDFLTDRTRCTEARLWVDTARREAQLALHCLHLLNRFLHKDLLGKFESPLFNNEIPDLESKIQAALPPEVQYACRYWATHLLNSKWSDLDVLHAALETFTCKSLLWWLEAMSWLGEVRLAIKSLEFANTWAVSTFGCRTALHVDQPVYPRMARLARLWLSVSSTTDTALCCLTLPQSPAVHSKSPDPSSPSPHATRNSRCCTPITKTRASK